MAAIGQRDHVRFIPTGVGNTASSCPTARSPPVHPHGRGEHDKQIVRVREVGGSSPRAWGTPRRHADQVEVTRFIPTGVGNTRCA